MDIKHSTYHKFRRMFGNILSIFVILAMAFPVNSAAFAAPKKEPVGDKISVFFGGYITFPAGEPFHIRHGFVLTSDGDANGVYDFELEVDGIRREEDFKDFWAESGDPDTLQRRWVFNFPEGMAEGTHTFIGRWFEPCQAAVDAGAYPGPCSKPNAKVETRSTTLTVEFTTVPPAMGLRVNYGHDWVESFYQTGHAVSITVTDVDGNIKAKADAVTEQKGYWGGEPGFQTNDLTWFDAEGNPMGGPPDIQPYDWVYTEVDNGVTAQVQIGDISGMIDLENDSIEGTIMASWITDPVPVECLDWGSGQEPPFDNKDGGSILTNGSDPYSCSWFGEWDIQYYQNVGVGYSGPDGHWVANAFFVRNPHFTVFPEGEWFDGNDWSDGATVDITVEGKPECTTSRVSWDYFFNGSFGEGCDVVIGDTVTFTDGETVRTHIVQNLAITEVDKTANMVTGTADVGALVYAWVHGFGETEMHLTVEDGNWLADFGSNGFDLVEGMGGRSEIRDKLGNSTAVDWWIPNPRFTVFPEWEWFDGYDWPDGATVSITVAGKTICDTSKVSWGGFFNGNFNNFDNGCNVEIGDVVTFTDDITTRTHTVRNLAVTAVNELSNTVSGASDPYETVYVWQHEPGPQIPFEANASGEWFADLNGVYDIRPGSGGRSEIRDGFGNSTAVDWWISPPPVTIISTSTSDLIASDGVCTLREAIIAANTNTSSGDMEGECPAGTDSQTDTILLSAGQTYSLTLDSTYENDARDGDLDIWDNSAATDLIIMVEGNGNATISQDAVVDDRVLENHGATVHIEGLTLTGGNVDLGGAILNMGTLSITGSMISGNTANVAGGGIRNEGTLIVKTTTISENWAIYGGGIVNRPDAMLIVMSSAITSNEASEQGGGIVNRTGGTVVVDSSNISGNIVNNNGGGGILNEGSLTITNSVISHNTANHDGGGIANTGTLVIDASDMFGNSGKGGGALANWPGGQATIQNGTTVHDNTAGGAAGLFNYGTLTVNDSIITHNTGEYAGGIGNGGGEVILSNTVVSDNSASASAGGVHNTEGGTITIENGSVISGNTAVWDGGGINNWDGTVTISNSTVSGNSTGQGGGGIFNLSMGTVVVDTSTISGNSANDGGGLTNWGGEVIITNSTVSENTAAWGGGIMTYGGVLTLDASTVSGNTASNDAGGLYNREGANVTIQNGSAISDNNASYGGGISSWASTLTIDASSISGNTATNNGGGILNKDGGTTTIQNGSTVSGNSASNGGGIANWAGTVTLTNSTVSGNSAGAGGGLDNWGTATVTNSQITGNTVTWAGGGIHNNFGGTLTVNTSTISDNSSDVFGGGIMNRDGTVTLTNSTITGNTTPIKGGGIANEGNLTVEKTILSTNTAGQGGGLYNFNLGSALIRDDTVIEGNSAGSGGGLFNASTMTVENSTVSSNDATDYGGGLFNWIGGTLTIDNTVVSNNSANEGGGLHNKEGSTATIKNGSIFSSNYAELGVGGIQNWGTITITGSVLRENTSPGDGDAITNSGPEGSTASVTASCIVGNGNTAVTNVWSVVLNFTGNWWGDASGPSGAGSGIGDSVGTNIDFAGWLNDPPSICAP